MPTMLSNAELIAECGPRHLPACPVRFQDNGQGFWITIAPTLSYDCLPQSERADMEMLAYLSDSASGGTLINISEHGYETDGDRPAFARVVSFLLALGYRYVRFDSEGNIPYGLPVYDEEGDEPLGIPQPEPATP